MLNYWIPGIGNNKIINRPLLPNEIQIDVCGKSKEEVFKEAVTIIDNYESIKDYNYNEPDIEYFESWVKSNNLD